VFEAVDVTVDRGDGVPVLHEVRIHAGPGEVIAVLGPSGSGKTSLALTVAGGRAPLAGTIRIPPRARVGVLPAFPERHFVSFTVEEEVTAEAPGADAAGALRAVGLPGDAEYLGRSPWGLSLGEQRRLAIASNLVRDRQLLVWDEPTASLDPRERRRLSKIVRALADSGTTILLTGHNLQWSSEVGARFVGILNDRLRGLDLTRDEDRTILTAMGYEIPRLWMFFAERVPGFWSDAMWRRSARELARLDIF
jgi:ABC-type multidrug transport system ATPase subunit